MAEFTFESFGQRLTEWQREIVNKQMSHALGKMAKEKATQAASADLGGDPKFSGWKPELNTRYDIVGPGAISFHPSRRSAGPWTVAESGRNSAEGPRIVGPRLTKTGRVSRAKVKRYNGRTAGKSTASDALRLIDKNVMRVVDKEVDRATRKYFD